MLRTESDVLFSTNIHSTVALVGACPTISTDSATEATMIVPKATIPTLFSVLGIQFLARG